jgi:DNA-binding NtrC family response regulator
MKSILVGTGDQKVLRTINTCFQNDGKPDSAPTKTEVLSLIQNNRYDLIFIDLDMLLEDVSSDSYKAAMQPFWNHHSATEIIVMTHQSNLRKAVMAVKAGARSYLTYPIDPEELKHVTESINESIILESELDYLRDKFWQIDSLELVQTNNGLMREVFSKIRSVSPTKSTVLILGETGTGKSMLAKLIHQHSNRKDAQFISVHCGAIPDTLMESELFGHEKGAFTGAVRRKLGKFEIAKRGTIFLDEIGTITPSAQVKLLQILQDGTFQRVGGEETLVANVRIITATNIDLKKMCDDGQFRKDLFYRLNVFPIEIPPMRERKVDIPFIGNNILKKLNKFYPKDIHAIHPSVIAAFEAYEWPGNIRELENLIERAYILETSSILTPESFPNELFDAVTTPVFITTGDCLTLAEVRRSGVEEIERKYLKEILAKNNGKINESAKSSGIGTRQLNKLMNKYGLRKEEFKGANSQPG